MSFGNPQILWLIPAAMPLLVWFLWITWRRRQKLVAQFVQSRLLAQLTVGVSQTRQKLRLTLLVLAVGLIMLALAGPRWGFAWEEAKQRGLDIVVAIDTSRSMLAEDLAPNRLTRAKLAALDLLRLAKTDRLGLVAFAGSAFLQCPLTLDDAAFRQSVDLLQVGIIPQGGTAITEAIRSALSAFKDEGDNDKVLVLFTDGEDQDSGALEAAQRAAQEGLRIFSVGVGTAAGELLRQRDEQSGQTTYIKDDAGNAVKSRLNETLLQQVATAANGFYLSLRDTGAIDSLYRDGLASLKKAEISSRFVKRFHERYHWPLTLAIACLLLEMFLPDRRRVERSEEIAAAANAGLKKALAALLLALLPLSASASSSSALEKYAKREYEAALQEYLQLHRKRPHDGRLAYNAGAAAYRAGQFDLAVTNLNTALSTPDLPVPLQQKSYYNLGNSLFRAGEQAEDPNERSARWQQAVERYESALKLDANDSDAKFNRDLVKKKLEELKQQQQQQKKDQQDPKDEKKDDQKQQEQKDQGDNSKQDKQQEQGKQDQQPQPQPKDQPDQEKQKDDRQSQKPDPKEQQKEQQEEASKPQDPSGEKPEGGQQPPAGQTTPLGQMTPQQAEQMLDLQKGEERALLFIPPQEGTPARARRLRDW